MHLLGVQGGIRTGSDIGDALIPLSEWGAPNLTGVSVSVQTMWRWSTRREEPKEPSPEQLQEAEDSKRRQWRATVAGLIIAGIGVTIAAATFIKSFIGDDPQLGIVEQYGTSNRECGLDQLAMFTPKPASQKPLGPGTLPRPVRGNIQATLWGTAFIQFTMTAGADSSFTVLSIETTDTEPISRTPTWLYSRSWDGCGSIGDRIVYSTLNLDTHRFAPLKSSTTALAVRSGEPFEPFSVTKDATFTLKIYVSACHRSERFYLRLGYQKAGTSEILTQKFGPYDILAANVQAPIFQEKLPGPTQVLQAVPSRNDLLKPVQGCSNP